MKMLSKLGSFLLTLCLNQGLVIGTPIQPIERSIGKLQISNMIEIEMVKALEDYYNEIQGSYNVILSPSFQGGYASWLPRADGKDNLYACLSTTNIQDNIPYLSWDNLIGYVWHEFGHSFVNPLTEKYIDRVMSVENLFMPIKEEMSRQAYPRWELCVNEHIIRATVIRLVELHFNAQISKEMLDNELSEHFVYIEPLIEKLKEFERQRDENQITFSEFYPELLSVLDSLQK